MTSSLARNLRDRAAAGLVMLLIAVTSPAWAANYPLELVSPRAAGTTPAAGFAAMPSGHRIFKAYPGLAYNIRAVVIGGAYPFAYALSNAPAGMTINEQTGEINWPNPQASAAPTITVVDSEGTRVSASWSISVTTEGFKFVSANGSDANAGTLSAPWRTLQKLHSTSVSSDIVYFRAGTYTADGIPRTSVGTAWERVEFGSLRSAQWIAYPGEVPVINFGYIAGSDPGVLIRFQPNPTNPVYLDGLEGRNFRNIGFQIVSGNGDYAAFRRLKIHDMIQGVDGENPSGIMFTSSFDNAAQYCSVQDSEFYRMNGGGALKFYSQKKLLVEDNLFRDSSYGFDLKGHVPRFDVRGNEFTSITSYVLFGNMATGTSGEPASGEIRFNNINTPNSAWSLDVNQDSMAREIYIYRNTLIGRVRARNVDSSDGPFRFRNNVIVNNDAGTPSGSHILFENVSDPARIVVTDNLAAFPSAGVVDSRGLLAGESVRYIGMYGHQLGDLPVAPNPPSSVIVE